jgi:hypothetical protein
MDKCRCECGREIVCECDEAVDLSELAGAVAVDLLDRDCLAKIESNAASLLMVTRTGLDNGVVDWYSVWALAERMMGLAEQGGGFAWADLDEVDFEDEWDDGAGDPRVYTAHSGSV